MKTNTLLLIGLLAGLVIISSQLRPQKMSFYKDNNNYVIDNNHIIKDVKKISDKDIATMIKLQNSYGGILRTNFLVNKINRNWITRGCLMKANLDWSKYGDLKTKVDGILKKYGAKELDKNYYSIHNNQVVTQASLLTQKDLATFDKLSIRGADEYTICPVIGKKNLNNFIRKNAVNSPVDIKINSKLESVLKQYR
jgi:hypothetical protein